MLFLLFFCIAPTYSYRKDEQQLKLCEKLNGVREQSWKLGNYITNGEQMANEVEEFCSLIDRVRNLVCCDLFNERIVMVCELIAAYG
jgi:hypothetical protein